MPPKKKEPKKQDDKKHEDAEPDEEEKELLEKELVISYLKSKLGRYQDQGERLQIENIKLSDELENQKVNLRDINEFLTNELKARSLTTAALEEKVQEMTQQAEESKKAHEAEVARLRAEQDAEVEALQAACRDYERKVKTSSEFLEQRDELVAELAAVKQKLDDTVRSYEERLSEVDRQQIQERERWKRELAAKIKETKAAMMRLTDNQLEITTKRTILENEQMSSELAFQSRQTEKLIARNRGLQDENAELRRQLQLSANTEEELARRNHVYQKTIKSLLLKLKDHGEVQQEGNTVLQGAHQQLAEAEEQLHLASLQLEDKSLQLERVQQSLEEARAQVALYDDGFRDTVRFLVQCWQDLKGGLAAAEGSGRGSTASDQGEEEDAEGGGGLGVGVREVYLDSAGLTPEQRQRALGYLLQKLEIFQSVRQVDFGLGTHHFAPSPTSSSDQGPPVGSSLPPITASQQVPGPLAALHSHRGPAARSASGMSPPQPASPGGASWGSGGAWDDARPSSRLPAKGPQPHQPHNEELLASLMSDVRPWGRKASELPLSTRNTSTFLKRGTGAGAGQRSLQ